MFDNMHEIVESMVEVQVSPAYLGPVFPPTKFRSRGRTAADETPALTRIGALPANLPLPPRHPYLP